MASTQTIDIAGFKASQLKFDEPGLIYDTLRYKQARALIEKEYAELIKNHSKFEYRDYQAKYSPLILTKKQVYLAHDMGVGKTLEGGLAIKALYGKVIDQLRPGVIQILAPVRIILGRWVADLSALELGDYIDIIDEEAQIYSSTKPIWLYTYRFLSRESKKSLSDKRKGLRYRTRLIDDKEEKQHQATYLYKIIKQSNRKPNFLICDEIHNCRKGTLKSNCLYELSKCARRRVGLSGTPVDGRAEHLEAPFKLIYGNESLAFPYKEGEFSKMFQATEKTKGGYLADTDTNMTVEAVRPMMGIPIRLLPVYTNLVNRLIHRLSEDDPEVMKFAKFPPANTKSFIVPMDPEHADIYKAALKQKAAILLKARKTSNHGADTLQHIQVLKEISSAPWNKNPQLNTSAKAEAIVKLVDEAIQQKRRVVIFTGIVAVGNHLKTVIEQKTSAKVVRLFAEDPSASPSTQKPSERDAILELYQNNEADVIISQYNLAAEGIDLTNGSVVILHDLPWRSILVQQAVKRCVRPGQVHPFVDVYWMQHAGTIDTYVERIVRAKLIANKKMVDCDHNFEVFTHSATEEGYDLDQMIDDLLAD